MFVRARWIWTNSHGSPRHRVDPSSRVGDRIVPGTPNLGRVAAGLRSRRFPGSCERRTGPIRVIPCAERWEGRLQRRSESALRGVGGWIPAPPGAVQERRTSRGAPPAPGSKSQVSPLEIPIEDPQSPGSPRSPSQKNQPRNPHRVAPCPPVSYSKGTRDTTCFPTSEAVRNTTFLRLVPCMEQAEIEAPSPTTPFP